jgi:hypothetical protein
MTFVIAHPDWAPSLQRLQQIRPQVLEAVAELAQIVDRQQKTEPCKQDFLIEAGKPRQTPTSLGIRFEEFSSACRHI